MDFYIFRHGETYFSKNKLPYYEEQIESAEILPEGIPAIEKLAHKLKNIQTDANFTSPYRRCLQTTEIVEKISGKKFKIDERLHDFKSEPIKKMAERLNRFLKEIKDKNYKSIAICTHGYPIAVLRSLITKGKFELDKLNYYPKPGILTVIKNGKVKLIDFN
jgi:broad specificity phosphatase PhoE